MPTIFPSRCKTHFQLIHAAAAPKASHLTSISLYMTTKFQGLLSAKIFPMRSMGSGLPRPRHAVAALSPWLSKMYLRKRETGRAHEIISPAVPESVVFYSPANLAAAPVATTNPAPPHADICTSAVEPAVKSDLVSTLTAIGRWRTSGWFV